MAPSTFAANGVTDGKGDPIGEDTNHKLSGGMIFLIILLLVIFLLLIAFCIWYIWKKNKE